MPQSSPRHLGNLGSSPQTRETHKHNPLVRNWVFGHQVLVHVDRFQVPMGAARIPGLEHLVLGDRVDHTVATVNDKAGDGICVLDPELPLVTPHSAVVSKGSSDNRGWSFQKWSARHRVLSNTIELCFSKSVTSVVAEKVSTVKEKK